MECLREYLEFETWMYETARKAYEQRRIKYTLTRMLRLGRYTDSLHQDA